MVDRRSGRKRLKKISQRLIDDEEEEFDPEEPDPPLHDEDDIEDGGELNGDEQVHSDCTSRSASSSTSREDISSVVGQNERPVQNEGADGAGEQRAGRRRARDGAPGGRTNTLPVERRTNGARNRARRGRGRRIGGRRPTGRRRASRGRRWPRRNAGRRTGGRRRANRVPPTPREFLPSAAGAEDTAAAAGALPAPGRAGHRGAGQLRDEQRDKSPCQNRWRDRRTRLRQAPKGGGLVLREHGIQEVQCHQRIIACIWSPGKGLTCKDIKHNAIEVLLTLCYISYFLRIVISYYISMGQTILYLANPPPPLPRSFICIWAHGIHPSAQTNHHCSGSIPVVPFSPC